MYNYCMFDVTATTGKYEASRVMYENFFGHALIEFFRTTHLKLRDIEKIRIIKTDLDEYAD